MKSLFFFLFKMMQKREKSHNSRKYLQKLTKAKRFSTMEHETKRTIFTTEKNEKNKMMKNPEVAFSSPLRRIFVN